MKKLIIMAGLPGAGKSFLRDRFFQNLSHIDCDEIKQNLPGYDPKNPSLTHAQSKILEKEQLYTNLANGISFVYDTTAGNSDFIVALSKEAQELGYETTLVHINVRLDIALERNAKRERNVPEEFILDRYAKMESCVSIISKFTNHFIQIDNNSTSAKFTGCLSNRKE